MKKSLAVLGLALLLAVGLAVLPAAAAPKFEGTWTISDNYIDATGVVTGPLTRTMVLNKDTTNPSLFYGTITFAGNTSGTPDLYITGQIDSGSNFHFAVSSLVDPLDLTKGFQIEAMGRGTVSSSNFTGSYSNMAGETGTLKGKKNKQ